MRDSAGRLGRGGDDDGWKTGNGRDDAREVIEAGDAPERGGHEDILVGDDGHEVSDLGMFN